MSKKVDNGVKKFFVIFLGFVVILNILSILLFRHDLFYYWFGAVHVYTDWTRKKFSMEYSNILKYSMISRIMFFVILVCFFLFMYFVKKKVKNNRRFIYPIMFLLFLLILEFGVLSFFDNFLPFFKDAHTGWFIPEELYVTTYIDFLHPLGLQANIILIFLMIVGNMVDNRNLKEKQSLDKTLLQLAAFYIIILVLLQVLGLL